MTLPDATACLIVSCLDRQGIIAAVSGFLAERGANIVASDQYSTDPEGGAFFLRMEFHLDGVEANRDELESAFTPVAESFGMRWRITYPSTRRRVALLASRYDHCLLDLLWRWRRGELDCDIHCVVSNHPDLERDVSSFGVSFHHVPVAKGGNPAAEAQMLELLAGRVDLVVLARYMQILSADFLDTIGCSIINIHHSFLPAFIGANPYARARERGVKLIGATAHYATRDIDEGPIIEQDVIRVTHRQTAEELERIGSDIERIVLARAVQWHLDDRVFVHGDRTVLLG